MIKSDVRVAAAAQVDPHGRVAVAEGAMASRLTYTSGARTPELDDTNVTTYRIVDGDPLSARVRSRCSSTLARGEWHTRVETDSHMTATATEFLVTHARDAYEGDERVYTRTWTMRLPRDGV